MLVALASTGEGAGARVSQVFARCPFYVFHDTGTGEYESMPNPALEQPGGAGVRAAELICNRGAEAVIAGNFGPKAFSVLLGAGARCFRSGELTLAEAVEALSGGKLEELSSASTDAHYGTTGAS
ncbi:NifB/NifX family molybdenum-iron cluster-binding protein [Candidatus Fermentibacterales bacterium]|nr:NifB/NifX family molybdenum-iron cluster-binding protein [Candidatus Fermentibacterales bacterium]